MNKKEELLHELSILLERYKKGEINDGDTVLKLLFKVFRYMKENNLVFELNDGLATLQLKVVRKQ